MEYRRLAVLLCLTLVASPCARAELVVVVNPDSGVVEMTHREVINIYMGRFQALPSGITAFPVDLEPRKEAFYENLVGRTLPEINSYWARLVFSGKASPPRPVASAGDVNEVVANNKGAIGYLDQSEVNGARVRVVLRLAQ